MIATWLYYAFMDGIVLFLLLQAVRRHDAYATHYARERGTPPVWLLRLWDVATAFYLAGAVLNHFLPEESPAFIVLTLLLVSFSIPLTVLTVVWVEADKRLPATPPRQPPPPPDQIDEAWVRHWTEQMDEVSQEHLKQVLHESE